MFLTGVLSGCLSLEVSWEHPMHSIILEKVTCGVYMSHSECMYMYIYMCII